ncbi:MAG: spore coat U domain-containing protein [Oxalicibacterium faecigallinarum]|uniref:Csu type fimbrial protein n=1 Tax=Oxalicibacterium faecigallinarum TaxID=573741 RepID=UPI002809E538|nr:spore coat U domain-containing protein [Oxalicibacterium faecigallinarum]MDQ7970058.1 spore coat U domain-containing protein [Oxalicibacterium faecigallinarum]
MKKWIFAGLLFGLSQQASALCLAPLCSCNVSATPIAFGSFDPLPGLAQDATGSVTMTCNGVAGLLIPFRIALSSGAGTLTNRKMINGTRNLYYNIYSDTNRTTVWGDGTTGAPNVSGNVLLNLLGTLTVKYDTYGRITAGQTTLVPGTYADTIVVTLTYD